MSDRRAYRSLSRIPFLLAVGTAPIAALAWIGCSDDPVAGSSISAVDPGGTFGAEVSIQVVGRGRVTSTNSVLDCPSDCFAKLVFANGAADGAAGGIALKANPTPGARFLGWKFDTDLVGSRGRGNPECNPINRAATVPTVGSTDVEITLPYGETDGTPPAGKEASCIGVTKVPVVYRVTAMFDPELPVPVEAGAEGGLLDGGDAGDGTEVVYTTSVTGAVGRDFGITSSGYAYWHFSAAGQSGIAFGSNPGGSAPQFSETIVAPSSPISLFEVDPGGVVYQTAPGVVRYIQQGSTSGVTMGGASVSCTALAVDTSGNVYCRQSSSILEWDAPSYLTQNVLYTNVPFGNDLLVEGSSIYFSTSSAIQSLPAAGMDGGVGTPSTVVSGRSSPTNLEASTSRFWWIESASSFYASSFKGTGTSATNTNVSSSGTLKYSSPDANSSSSYWVASTSAIQHADAFGTSSQTFRSGLSGIAGIASDGRYVYWLDGAARVVRASR